MNRKFVKGIMDDFLSAEDSKAVMAILTHELGIEAAQLTSEASLVEDLGADSLTLVQIQMALEERFNVTIADDRIERVHTIGEVFELVAECLQPGRSC